MRLYMDVHNNERGVSAKDVGDTHIKNTRPRSPTPKEREMPRRTFFILVTALLAVALPLSQAAAAPPSSDTQPVFAIATGDVVGSSTLTRSDTGLSMTLHTSGLPAGDAVTIWWVIFNEPGNCLTSPCGEPDLFNPAAVPSVQRAAGHVIGGNGVGNFGGQLSVGDPSEAWPLYTGPGVLDPRTAEIWLVVHEHGPAIPGLIDFMIHSFGGGCANLPPFTGPNACVSTQVSIYLP